VGTLINILGSVFCLFGLFIVFSNYVRQVSNYRNSKKENGKWSSPAPFFGPLFIIVGYSLLPFEFTWWILLAIVLDPDTLIMIIGLPHLVRAFRK
jgi:hypothetical protein